MPELTPENVFAINPNIRWAGLATDRGKVIFCKMRPGVKSATPEEDDRLLLELRAQYITEMTRQASQWAGPAHYIAISYEKFTELFVILAEKHLVVTLENSVQAQDFPRIAESIMAMKT